MGEVWIITFTSLCRIDPDKVSFPLVFLQSLSNDILMLNLCESLKDLSMFYYIGVGTLVQETKKSITLAVLATHPILNTCILCILEDTSDNVGKAVLVLGKTRSTSSISCIHGAFVFMHI